MPLFMTSVRSISRSRCTSAVRALPNLSLLSSPFLLRRHCCVRITVFTACLPIVKALRTVVLVRTRAVPFYFLLTCKSSSTRPRLCYPTLFCKVGCSTHLALSTLYRWLREQGRSPSCLRYLRCLSWRMYLLLPRQTDRSTMDWPSRPQVLYEMWQT